MSSNQKEEFLDIKKVHFQINCESEIN